jgi:hypothetical protein
MQPTPPTSRLNNNGTCPTSRGALHSAATGRSKTSKNPHPPVQMHTTQSVNFLAPCFFRFRFGARQQS